MNYQETYHKTKVWQARIFAIALLIIGSIFLMNYLFKETPKQKTPVTYSEPLHLEGKNAYGKGLEYLRKSMYPEAREILSTIKPGEDGYKEAQELIANTYRQEEINRVQSAKWKEEHAK